MYAALVALFLFGHLALWVALFNRAHARPIPCRLIRLVELVLILVAAGGLAWFVQQAWSQRWFASLGWITHQETWLSAYIAACSAFGVWAIAQWTHRRFWLAMPRQLLSNHTRTLDVAEELGYQPVHGWSTRLFASLPTNQMLSLSIQEKELQLPGLPAAWDGLSITHLSDLHFTGRIQQPFFDYVVDRANEFDSDLVAITGDILEVEDCFPWLSETLGRLVSRHGIVFVLGNHDKRLPDVERLRRELVDLGFHDVGRSPWEMQLRGGLLQVVGNELPWFGPPAEPEVSDSEPALRMLLAHSPDQISWARERGYQLMLAGHTHGGHIRLPGVGPMVCPSRFGVKYASGVFYEPPTLMHVSRGISGLDPLRFNCPPELAKLVLRSC